MIAPVAKMTSTEKQVSGHPAVGFMLTTIGVFVGVVAGFAAHSQLDPIELRPLQTSEDSGSQHDPELLAALRELTDALRELRTAPPAPVSVHPAMSERVVAASGDAKALGDLTGAMSELRETIHEMRLGRNPSAATSLVTPSLDHRNWLPELPPDTENPMGVHQRQHLLWTEQRILDAYGVPDRIADDGPGISVWFYSDESRARSFQVRFQDGRVIAMGFSK